MTAGDERLYKIDGSKVWLSPTAVAYAAEYFGPGRKGVIEMAKYLRMVGADESGEGAEPAPEAVAREDFLPDAAPSEQIEDRRQDPEYVPDKTQQLIWGPPVANVPLQARAIYSGPLGQQLGVGDVGKRTAPGVPVLGPTAPQWPAAFGNYRPLPDEYEGNQ
jgi:hypothetical protein